MKKVYFPVKRTTLLDNLSDQLPNIVGEEVQVTFREIGDDAWASYAEAASTIPDDCDIVWMHVNNVQKGLWMSEKTNKPVLVTKVKFIDHIDDDDFTVNLETVSIFKNGKEVKSLF